MVTILVYLGAILFAMLIIRFFYGKEPNLPKENANWLDVKYPSEKNFDKFYWNHQWIYAAIGTLLFLILLWFSGC